MRSVVKYIKDNVYKIMTEVVLHLFLFVFEMKEYNIKNYNNQWFVINTYYRRVLTKVIEF